MVDLVPPALFAWLVRAAVVFADVVVPPRKLEGPLKARVLAALAGLIILGFAMVALTWLGARFTRRYMDSGRRRRESGSRPHEDDWAEKPLNATDDDDA